MLNFMTARMYHPLASLRHKLLEEDGGANFKALLGGALFAALAQMFLANRVNAQDFIAIADQICSWAPTVSAIGTALAFIVFIFGVIMVAIGSRDGFGRAIWAVIGAVALFTISQLFNLLTGGDCGQGDGG